MKINLLPLYVVFRLGADALTCFFLSKLLNILLIILNKVRSRK